MMAEQTGLDNSVSVTTQSRTITLQDLQDLAPKGSQIEAATALGVNSKTFKALVIDRIPGAENIQFSYYCRREGCSKKGVNLGSGYEGLCNYRGHNNTHPREPKQAQQPASQRQKKVVVKPSNDELRRARIQNLTMTQMTEKWSVSQPTVSKWMRDAGLARRRGHPVAIPLAKRIQILEALAAPWILVEEGLHCLQARMDELQTANPGAKQAAEQLAKIREILESDSS